MKEAGGEITVEELYDWPRGYFGDELDKALHLDDAEREKIVQGFVETFMTGGQQNPARLRNARIRRLIERIDDFSNAAEIVRQAAEAEPDRAYAEGYMLGKLLPFLEEERDEANDRLEEYREEVGE